MAGFAKVLVLSDEVLFNRVAGGGAARGNLNLPVDRGQVCTDRARTDHQVHGDLRVRPALSDQAQHLHLAGGQIIRIGQRRGGFDSGRL